MELKKYLNLNLIGLLGALLLIISEFLQWFSDDTLFELFLITTSVAIEDSFLFLFPLMSGIICLIGNILITYKMELKVKSAIVSFIGLGFLLIFFIDYISQVIQYISNANIGFYLGTLGFLLILVHLINLLMSKEKNTEGR
jgi:hypothetical protein